MTPSRRFTLALIVVAACSGKAPSDDTDRDAGTADAGFDASSNGTDADVDAATPTACSCSSDGHDVLDCDGNVFDACTADEGCSAVTLGCIDDPCAAAATLKTSIGCEFYPTLMDIVDGSGCFAAIVTNTSGRPVSIAVERGGTSLPVESFARVVTGTGPSPTYTAYVASEGLAVGASAVLFLVDGTGGQACPMGLSAATGETFSGTRIGDAFHVTTDFPVAVQQVNPYGGRDSMFAGAALLLPTSSWDTDYLLATGYSENGGMHPSLDLIAMADDTVVTIRPRVAIEAGIGVAATNTGTPLTITLERGEVLQITQAADLSGSRVEASKPIGHMAGHVCMTVPVGVLYCEHAEQMIPPLGALGTELVGVMHSPRAGESSVWRILAAEDNTVLSYTPPIAGAPTSVEGGQFIEFTTATPFVVRSGADHPILMLSYMVGDMNAVGLGGADVTVVPPVAQYLSRYTFFAEPMYPETGLVVVRARRGGVFEPVVLDCEGALGDWHALGTDYEWTRTKLSTGDFAAVDGCQNGRHEASSDGPFGLWVWAWGAPASAPGTGSSVGYPAGMGVRPIYSLE